MGERERERELECVCVRVRVCVCVTVKHQCPSVNYMCLCKQVLYLQKYYCNFLAFTKGSF